MSRGIRHGSLPACTGFGPGGAAGQGPCEPQRAEEVGAQERQDGAWGAGRGNPEVAPVVVGGGAEGNAGKAAGRGGEGPPPQLACDAEQPQDGNAQALEE